MAYAVSHYSVRPTGDFPAGRGSALHQPKRNNPDGPIAEIFIPMDNIISQGRGKESKKQGKRPQGPAGGRGEKSRKGWMEWGRSRKAVRKGRDREEEDDRTGEDGGKVERGRRGQESQVSSDRDWGERRKRDGIGESDDASKEWSGADTEDSAEAETEEDRMTAGEPEGTGNTLTASSWGIQDSGAGGLQGGARSDGSDTGKDPSKAANEGGGTGPPWGEAGARRK